MATSYIISGAYKSESCPMEAKVYSEMIVFLVLKGSEADKVVTGANNFPAAGSKRRKKLIIVAALGGHLCGDRECNHIITHCSQLSEGEHNQYGLVFSSYR
jgi:hypothetical protein